ncbi:hypothetical protein SDC9_185054 [bioreactor metagenome]|uniref:Uncharacterized protein n=1 Tax=bioreactor metagenome TaxID=1076179 RepID=A0A645HN54_9ZZZZ
MAKILIFKINNKKIRVFHQIQFNRLIIRTAIPIGCNSHNRGCSVFDANPQDNPALLIIETNSFPHRIDGNILIKSIHNSRIEILTGSFIKNSNCIVNRSRQAMGHACN